VVSPLHRPPKRGCPLLPWACSPVRWLKLSGLHSPSEEGMLTGRAVPFELRVHPTFSSAAARILQYITGALAPDSAPAPDALRCGPPSTAPLRPREVQDGSRVGFGGSASSVRSVRSGLPSSGFLAALPASVLPREAHGAFSGLVSFFSHPVDVRRGSPRGSGLAVASRGSLPPWCLACPPCPCRLRWVSGVKLPLSGVSPSARLLRPACSRSPPRG
jgi:hypothetical protein